MSHGKTHTKTKFARAKGRVPAKSGNTPSLLGRSGTKQEAVLALLGQPKGATIAVIRKATGWHETPGISRTFSQLTSETMGGRIRTSEWRNQNQQSSRS
jgi:hypothetical protein